MSNADEINRNQVNIQKISSPICLNVVYGRSAIRNVQLPTSHDFYAGEVSGDETEGVLKAQKTSGFWTRATSEPREVKMVASSAAPGQLQERFLNDRKWIYGFPFY